MRRPGHPTAITIHNTGVALDVYTIRFTLAPGQTFTLSWDLAWLQVGNEVVRWAGGLSRGTRTFQIVTSGPAHRPPPSASTASSARRSRNLSKSRLRVCPQCCVTDDRTAPDGQ